MSGARVDISLDELDEMRARIARSHEEAGKLAARVKELEIAGAGDRADELLATIGHALTIVQYAVSNLDPRTILGWPWPALAAFADSLGTLPGGTDHQKEVSIELRAFARECELLEIERRNRPKPPPDDPEIAAL